MLEEAGARFEPAPASPPARRLATLVRFAVNFARSVRLAVSILRRERVDRVVAMGGFVAAPVVQAARLAGVGVTLVNLDAPPGRANRWIARRTRHVLSAVEVPERPGFARAVVGMPVRRGALALADAETCRRGLGLDPARPTLLVTGASQGSRSINEMLARLAADDPGAFAGWQVLHLCGSDESARLRAAYGSAGIAARVEPFLHEMGAAWGSADVAVSRAGASSVAEAWANAVPTLFMPYPFHQDCHQHRNAEPMVACGGALVADDRLDPAKNAAAAGAVLRELLRDRPRQDAMRAALRRRPARDAAGTVARLLLERTRPGDA
jgi:UDP-N-acetylglucosamine--N-acetylmuramyl-(pentapeptide) pyrophosphoryl-undecaprenol N-acetylglucosamine transferase